MQAGGREVRVSSADRIIFPATERTPVVTKLDVVNYYLSVGDGIMRALARRPTTLERWPKGVFEGAKKVSDKATDVAKKAAAKVAERRKARNA